MKVEDKFTFNAPRETVWELLMDPQALQNCLPGCERFEQVGEGEFEATLNIGVAAVRGKYDGKVQLTDLEPPERYTMKIEGSGGPGHLNGTGYLELEEHDGKTIVKVQGEAQAGGLIGSIGQRMLGGVAKMVMGQFFKCMAEQIPKTSGAQTS